MLTTSKIAESKLLTRGVVDDSFEAACLARREFGRLVDWLLTGEKKKQG